jgi:hypothetical protein
MTSRLTTCPGFAGISGLKLTIPVTDEYLTGTLKCPV